MLELPLSGLSLPTTALMSLGGDDRITIDERSGLNSYGCAPAPMLSVMYSSSTASSISAEAFRHVQAIHYLLRSRLATETPEAIYAQSLETARQRLRLAYGLDEAADIAFGPSGTDLEYLSLALALRAGAPVCNLVVEVEEVGSGCQFSQDGRYFASRTALGKLVTQGEPLAGFTPDRIRVETVHVRTQPGPLQADADYDDAIATAVSAALERGERPLLHVVHRSKTGIVAPSLAGLDRLLARFGDRLDVTVDACQGRISPEAEQAYVERGAVVFITGSKFFGGPPFSAFAIVPPPLAARMRGDGPGDGKAPAGLGDFYARAEMPESWHGCDGVLPRSANFGMLLRLEAALFEIERFFALPTDQVDAIITAFNRALWAIGDTLPFRLVDAQTASDLDAHGSNPLDRKMLHVVELTLRHPASGQPLRFEEARSLYRMLYRDISAHFDSPEDILTASEICHLGQPVRCLRTPAGEWAPTLRFALSAPLMSALLGLDAGRLAERFRADLERVGHKLRLAATLLGAADEEAARAPSPSNGTGAR
jgi:hypothetical protein